MQGNPSTVVYGCGCTSVLTIPAHLSKATIQLVDSKNPSDVFDVEIVRISEAPPVFLEDLGTRRPPWAQMCHAMIPFDIKLFANADVKEFEPLFALWRERFGPMVPQCMLPDILQGRGRFFGLWKGQTYKGRRVGHLRLVEDEEVDESSPETAPTETASTSPEPQPTV